MQRAAWASEPPAISRMASSAPYRLEGGRSIVTMPLRRSYLPSVASSRARYCSSVIYSPGLPAALSATMVSAPCSSPGWWMGHSHPLIVPYPALLPICEPVTKDAAQLRRTVWADVPGEPRLNSGGRSITVHDHTLILEESTPISEAWSGIMPNLVRCHFFLWREISMEETTERTSLLGRLFCRRFNVLWRAELCEKTTGASVLFEKGRWR